MLAQYILNTKRLTLLFKRNYSLVFKSLQSKKPLFNLKKNNENNLLFQNSSKIFTNQIKNSSQNLSQEDKTVILNRKLDELKLKNILLYSAETQGSLKLNIIGGIAALFISYVGYTSYKLFGTIKVPELKEGEDEPTFRMFLNKIGEDSFRRVVCLIVVTLGNYFFKCFSF
jgi:hypothetical protein